MTFIFYTPRELLSKSLLKEAAGSVETLNEAVRDVKSIAIFHLARVIISLFQLAFLATKDNELCSIGT